MINIGFTVVPLVSIVLRPTGRLATIHSGPFLFNEVRPLFASPFIHRPICSLCSRATPLSTSSSIQTSKTGTMSLLPSSVTFRSYLLRLAYVLRKQWGLSLRMFYLLGSEELDEISDD